MSIGVCINVCHIYGRRIYTHMCRHMPRRTSVHVHLCKDVYTHVYTKVYTHVFAQVCAHAYRHAYLRAYTSIHMRACTSTSGSMTYPVRYLVRMHAHKQA